MSPIIFVYPRRSSSYPHGLPKDQLTAHDVKTLEYSNKVTANTMAVMVSLVEQGVPHTIEHPVHSLLQKERSFKHWAAVAGADRALVDYCRFGKPYRKRTAIWAYPQNLLDGLQRLCKGKHTHKATLSGWGEKDKHTCTGKGSSAYPRALCTEMRCIVLKNLEKVST